jgi:hypothetical protein
MRKADAQISSQRKVRQFHYEADGNKHSVNLRQIVALRDFADVKSGDEGGWLDNEAALSHEGECWIYDPIARCLPVRKSRAMPA